MEHNGNISRVELGVYQMQIRGENKTTIDVVVISDHKDSENKHPLDIYRAED